MGCTDDSSGVFVQSGSFTRGNVRVEVGHLVPRRDDYDFTSIPLHYRHDSISEGNNKDEVDNHSTGNGV
jgi:hypothetical protein